MKGPVYNSEDWDFLGSARGYYVLRRKSDTNKEYVFTSRFSWIEDGKRTIYKMKSPMDGYANLFELLK